MKDSGSTKWRLLAILLLVAVCVLFIPEFRKKNAPPIPTATRVYYKIPMPTLMPTQSVAFQGRLLLERFLKQGNKLESAGIYEFSSGMGEPVESTLPRPDKPIAISPDGRYAVVLPHHLKDTQTGEISPLPMDAFHKDPDATVSADFSPDREHLAFSVFSKTETPALFILELASNSSNLIFYGACADYTSGRICDYLGKPLWLDPDTFLFCFHTGGMPTVIDDNTDDPRNPNRLTVMSQEGSEILTLDESDTRIPWDYDMAGKTIFFKTSGSVWLDADELADGSFKPHSLPSGILFGTISPDGRYILQPGQPWQLIEVRTNKRSDLGTSTSFPVTAFNDCLWSTDQTRIACGGYSFVVVVPISEAPGGVVFTWIYEEETWRLLDWLP